MRTVTNSDQRRRHTPYIQCMRCIKWLGTLGISNNEVFPPFPRPRETPSACGGSLPHRQKTEDTQHDGRKVPQSSFDRKCSVDAVKSSVSIVNVLCSSFPLSGIGGDQPKIDALLAKISLWQRRQMQIGSQKILGWPMVARVFSGCRFGHFFASWHVEGGKNSQQT